MIITYSFQIRGLIDPTKKFIFLDVSKNASTKILTTLHNAGWTVPPVIDHREKKNFLSDKIIFSVLREPYERWVSGFTTFAKSPGRLLGANGTLNLTLYRLLNSEHWYITLQSIFEFNSNFEFDLHTQLQCDCFDSYNDTNTDINFFLLNENVWSNLQNWCDTVNLEIFFNDRYVNQTAKSNLIYNRIASFLDTNPRYKEKLMNWLQPDYNFFNSVKFVAQ
jgi:hypothetical protein